MTPEDEEDGSSWSWSWEDGPGSWSQEDCDVHAEDLEYERYRDALRLP